MKTTLITVMLMLLMVSSVSAELIGSGTSLDVELLTYTPVPAQPGDTIDLWLQVSNEGGTESNSGTIEILESYPFIVEREADRVRAFPPVPPQSNFLVQTQVRIDKEANEGQNYLTVAFQQDNAPTGKKRDVAITIQGRTGALTVADVTTAPAIIAPGDTGVISLTLENVGESLLRNVEVQLDLDGLSLAPTGSSDSKTVGMLEGKTRETFNFEVIAFPAAVANVYQVPVNITYESEQGSSYDVDKTIGVVIGSTPELLVYFEKNELSMETLEGEVVIKFVNKGLSEIKLLEMEILENEQVEVLSESPILYVGNIDEDDYESADIKLKISDEHVDVPVRIAYKDALNNPYEQTVTLGLDATNGNGKSKSMGAITWIVILVLVGVGIWLYRRRNKRK